MKWSSSISITQAIDLQKKWAAKVQVVKLGKQIQTVAGADVAFSPDGRQCVATIVLMSWPKLQLLGTFDAVLPVEFPYVPGLLSFREAPAILAAADKVPNKPDILIIDGQGLAHPRRFGLACHVGLKLNWPTIGCAKSRLTGTHRPVGLSKGCRCRLMDKKEVIGSVIRSRDNVKCLYVSVGHLVNLEESVKIVLRCCQKYRLAEPIRLAHQHVTSIRKSIFLTKS